MNDYEKQLAVFMLKLSRFYYARFGKYRSEINFLRGYSRMEREENKGRSARNLIIALYVFVFLTGAAVTGFFYYDIKRFEDDTFSILPKIDTEVETVRNKELADAQALLNEYRTVNGFYQDDERSFEVRHVLQSDDLQKFYAAADTAAVRFFSLSYSNDENFVDMSCEADSLNAPSTFVKTLKELFRDAAFDYSGYVVTDGGYPRFSVRCYFN